MVINQNRKKHNYILLKNTEIVTPYEIIRNGYLVIKDDKIHKIGNCKNYNSNSINRYNKTFDLKGLICVPGFIEIHTHGAVGVDITTNPSDINKVSKFKSTTGVTNYIPTLWSQLIFEDLLKSISNLSKFIDLQDNDWAKAIGLNLETPYLNPDLGAQKKNYCICPNKENNKRIIDSSYGKLFIINIAPEIKSALSTIRLFIDNDVVVSIGHSNANISLLHKAIINGANLATHLLNGTYHPVSKEPGVVPVGLNEYLMIRDDVYAEIIVDSNGSHIHPIMLNILLRCKNIDKIITITDSMYTSGLKPGRYILKDGRKIESDGSVNRLENGQLAGSAMTINKVLMSLIKQTGLNIKDAIKTATINPAKLLQIDDSVGSLKYGKKANITVINDNFDVFLTITEGRISYKSLSD